MQKQPLLTAVIPCYNEETALPSIIDRLKNVVDEIIVVDNGSTDQSLTVAKMSGARVILEPRKHDGIGYGYALMTGMQAAQGKYIVTVDADGEHPIERIPELMNYFIDGRYDVVSANRTHRISSKFSSRVREFGMWLLNTEVRVLYGYPIQDTISGMWMVRKDVVDALQLNEGGWDLSPQIKLAAIAHPCITYGEFPIVSKVRENGASKQILWKTGLQHAAYVFKYWYKNLVVGRLRQVCYRRFGFMYDKVV